MLTSPFTHCVNFTWFVGGLLFWGPFLHEFLPYYRYVLDSLWFFNELYGESSAW